MLNTTLWVAQTFVAAVMFLAGLMKVGLSREKLAERFHWAASWPRWQIKALGVAELAGGVGLVAPVATGIAPFLTPLAAVCLFVLMGGAVRAHRQLRESVVFPAFVAALCIFIAAGRIVEHEAQRTVVVAAG